MQKLNGYLVRIATRAKAKIELIKKTSLLGSARTLRNELVADEFALQLDPLLFSPNVT